MNELVQGVAPATKLTPDELAKAKQALEAGAKAPTPEVKTIGAD